MKAIWKDKKSAAIVLGVWLVIMTMLTILAPSAKEVTSPSENGGLPATASSVIAKKALEGAFPSQKGIPLFVVFKQDAPFLHDDINHLASAVEKQAKVQLATSIPLTQMSPQTRQSFLSDDGSTFFMPILFNESLESKEIHEEVVTMKESVENYVDKDVSVEWTGPAGIVSDTISLFSQADVVLLLATIGIVFVLLLLIYKSPVFAVLPLIGAGIVYGIVDRLLGLLGLSEWVTIENQALSIMTILLFAVITDYALLIFSRYREELRNGLTIEHAMKLSVAHVREPILFSGGTVLVAVLLLFTAVYEPYRNFAPVFATAIVVLLIAGLTLLPALFGLVGRKAFWPLAIDQPTRTNWWSKVAASVTSKPWRYVFTITIILGIGSVQAFTTNLSFNLLESFPDNMSSKKGYEQLAEAFSEGELAPTTLLLKSETNITESQFSEFVKILEKQREVKEVRVEGRPFADDSLTQAKVTLIWESNPYDTTTFHALKNLEQEEKELLQQAGIEEGSIQLSGETAKHANIQELNTSDTVRVMLLIVGAILIMLWWQTKSWLTGMLMIGTIVLSYGASLGFSVWLFDLMFHVDTVSYRIPLYTFVFLVALGVDYSIMLMSRIQQEAKTLEPIHAIKSGLIATGGVISSAGLLLAATFAVLITQPVLELQLFGFTVAFGVLIDTFIVRPMLLPALLTIQKR
ncbi:MMPL family transporter [Paenisporosarcina sp. NPDC076898]|uniref:MMPL family transporter n=1 Tax=unclassified Paenisporosarcina TaxID=2642018 RepID=UPI003D04889E